MYVSTSNFNFQITDDNNSFFLYYMDIGHSNFAALQRDQQLSVELNVFPSKLIHYIELCLRGPSMSNTANSPSTFSAKLDTATGSFSIVESTDFKQTTHISLPFTRGNDQTVKEYLAARLALSLQVSCNQAASIDRLTEQLEAISNVKEEMAAELHTLRYVTSNK